jgi:hypothetical protein
MAIDHQTVQVVHDTVNNAIHHNINDSPLSDAYSAPNSLVNDSGIPVLGQKQHATTEL